MKVETDPVRLKELIKKQHEQFYYNRVKIDPTQNLKEYPDTLHPVELDRTKKNIPVLKLSKRLCSRPVEKKKNKVKKEKVRKRGVYKWYPPREGFVMLNVSGSKSGGYGFILRDFDGKLIAAVAGVAEPVSPLYHQLKGVEEGLLHAWSSKVRRVEVNIHSLYTAMVVEGSHLVLKEDSFRKVFSTIERIEKLKSCFEDFYIDRCPSQSNRAAKYLSKLCKEANFCQVEELPSELGDIIEDDAICVTDAVRGGNKFCALWTQKLFRPILCRGVRIRLEFMVDVIFS